MAKNTLPVNYKDDILNSTMDGKRRYRMITNSDGTVSFEDVTTYDQVGSSFGAAQLNAANTAVNASADSNKIIDDLSTIAANTQEGYMAGALAVKELNQSLGLLSEEIQAVSKKQNFCKGSDRLLTDVLQIDFTNPTGESNSYGVIATEDASKLLNSPVTDGAFYAYREVLTIKSASKDYKVIVRLTEAYPSPGRTWIKAYNPDISDWSDWKVI